MKPLLLASAIVAALTWTGAGTAQAQTINPDRVVYFTFTQPVTIPGDTLPAGRYRFQIQQSSTDRGILHIDSPDGSKHFSTILVVPTTRTDPVQSPELRFLESAANVPPALGSYWYPATGMGWEFVYPKDQARQLAINTQTPILSGPAGQLAEQTSLSGLTRTAASGESTPYAASTTPRPVSGGVLRGSMDADEGSAAANENAANGNAANAASARASAASNSAAASASVNTAPSASASSSAPASSRSTASRTPNQPVTMAQNNAGASVNPDPNAAQSASSARTALPATAGTTPLVALAGVLALAAAFGLGIWRRFAA